jgi:riboflavin kinase/FMN adenylyltransferase
MKIIYGMKNIRKFPKPVVAIGVFDGVHKGHREILKAAAAKARSIKGTSIALTFWPHPQGEESIYSLEHRLNLIRDLGIGACIVLNFNKRLAQISAEDFIKKILWKKIGVSYVYVGENFRFGRNARGSVEDLEKASVVYNFKLRVFKVIKIRNNPISSTYIRTLIKRGHLSNAQKLLMRPVSVLGTVVKGTSLGRKLGFPTANINPHHEVIPPSGVYVAKVIFKNRKFYGACFIGQRNTEVYIFNFNKNIYGEKIEIQFIKRIRDPINFSSQSALAGQIRKDITFIKSFFSRH